MIHEYLKCPARIECAESVWDSDHAITIIGGISGRQKRLNMNAPYCGKDIRPNLSAQTVSRSSPLKQQCAAANGSCFKQISTRQFAFETHFIDSFFVYWSPIPRGNPELDLKCRQAADYMRTL